MMTKLRKIILGMLFSLLMGIAAMYVGSQIRLATQNNELTELLVKIKAQGQPVCAKDLYGVPVPDSENAAVSYQLAFRTLASPAGEGDMKALRGYLDRANGLGTPLSATETATFQVLVRKYSYVIPSLRNAAAKPACKFPVRWEQTVLAEFPHLVPLRDANALVCATALTEAKAGDGKGAAEDTVLALAMSDDLTDEPGLISQLVRYSMISQATGTIRTLVSEQCLDEGAIGQLDRALRQVDLLVSYKIALEGERAMYRTMYDDLVSGKLPIDEHDTGLPAVLVRRFTRFSVGMRADEYCCVDYLTKLIDRSPSYYRQGLPKLSESTDERQPMAWKSLCKIYPRALARRDSALAEVRGSQIVLALARYKMRFRGYPGDLTALNTGLGWQPPADPFSGENFIYRRAGSVYALYSIGSDLRDNVGRSLPPSRYDNGKGDIVWRVER